MKKILQAIAYLLFLGLSVLLLLEGIYRLQLLDFYKNELSLINENIQPEESKKRMLVIGDSFSAYPNNYVEQLSNHLQNFQFLNASVSGIGIRQQELFFEKRLEEFNPDIVFFQFYLGNDLIDIRSLSKFESPFFLKSLYLWLSDRFLVMKYLNYRLASFRVSEVENPEKAKSNYSSRVVQQFAMDPSYLQQTIMLTGKQKENYLVWKNTFSRLLKSLKHRQKPVLLIIPHVAQINMEQLKQFQNLGANLDTNQLNSHFPLLHQIEQDFPSLTLINPLSEFQSDPKPSELYYKNDPHLSPYGQLRLAQIILNNQEVFINGD